MINNLFFSLFLSMLFMLSCSVNNNVLTDENLPLKITEDYKKVEFYTLMEKEYFKYYLRNPKIVNSFPLKGDFSINPRGELCFFTLSKTHNINGTNIPANSHYQSYDDNFYLIRLSKDTMIQGLPAYHKEDGFIFWTENNLVFFKDGKLRALGLSKNTKINGIPCNSSKNNRKVEFYQNASLKQCFLALNKDIEGYPCQGGTEDNLLSFNSEGKLNSFFISKDFLIDSTLYEKGTQIILNNEKQVHSLSGKLHWVYFYDNGQILNCILEKDIEIDAMKISKKSRILFYETGELWQLKSRKSMIINGIPCMKNKFIGFYKDRSIKWCNLAQDYVIHGQQYKKGSWLDFDKKGRVK